MAFAFPVTELTLRVGDTPLSHLGQQIPALDRHLPILPEIDVESLFYGNRNIKFQDHEHAEASQLHSREITRNSNPSGLKRQQKLNTDVRSHRNEHRSQRRRRQRRPKQRMDQSSLIRNFETSSGGYRAGGASASQNRGSSIARIINHHTDKQQNVRIKSVSQVEGASGSYGPLIDRRGGAERAIKTKSKEAKEASTKEVSTLDHRSGQLPVDLPQQLLLTPIGPLEMVSDSKTPHFLLVPATPLKATWMDDGDTKALSPQVRENAKEELPSKDYESHQTNSNRRYSPSLQPTHVTTRIEIRDGVLHEIKPSIGVVKHFENLNKKGSELVENSSQFQNGNRGNDHDNLNGQIIFRNENGENTYSVMKVGGNNYAPEEHDTIRIFHDNDHVVDSHNIRLHSEIPFDHRRNGAEISDPGSIKINNAAQSVHRVPEISENDSGTVYVLQNDETENYRGTDSNQMKFHSGIDSSSSNYHVDTVVGNEEAYLRREPNGIWLKISSQGTNSEDTFSVGDSVPSSIQRNEFNKIQNAGQSVGNIDWPAFTEMNSETPARPEFNNVNKYDQVIQISDVHENQDHRRIDIDRRGGNFRLSELENKHRGTSVNYNQNIYIADGTTQPRETNPQISNWEKKPVQPQTVAHGDFDAREKGLQIVSAIPTRFKADAILETNRQNLHENSNHPPRGITSEVYSSSNHVPTDRRFVSEETSVQRLQNPFGELTNKEIVHNRDLTTRYSKRVYSSTRQPTGSIHRFPTRTVIRDDGHVEELQKENANEPKANSAIQYHPSSFHVQSYPHSNNFNVKPQTPNILSSLQGTRHGVDNEMNHSSRPANHVPIRYKFTEHDAATRPHSIPVTRSQQSHHTAVRFTKNDTYSVTPQIRENGRPNLTSKDKFSDGARRDKNSRIGAVHPTLNTFNELRKGESNVDDEENIYQSASNIGSFNLQNFQYDTPENVNLFEAVHLRSSQMPVNYIEYTTQNSVTESRFIKKDSSGRPRFESNPFFENFGPFPQLKLKNEVAARNSSDTIVFVTPSPDRSEVSEILKQSQFTDSKGVHFTPVESGQRSKAFMETSADTVSYTEISKDVKIEFHTNDKNTPTQESINIFDSKQNVSSYDVYASIHDASELHSYENLNQLSFSKNNQNNLETEEGEPVVKDKAHFQMNRSDSRNDFDASGNSERSNLEGNDSGYVSKLENGSAEAGERHLRNGGMLLDALVDMVKKASTDESLQGMLPPFSVLEVGVGERLAGPELSAESPHGLNHTLSLPTPASSAFTSMIQLGIALGVVIMMAVLLFHAPRLRRELCSKEKRERLRRLKQRYAEDTVSSASSVEFGSTSCKSQDGGNKSRTGSIDEKSDGESHYARVLDVSL